MAARVLVVVLAETRAHELTFTAFKENLLDRLGADLALCVGDGPRETPNPFYEHAKYVWKFEESKMAGAEDWSAAMDELSEGRNWRSLLAVPDSWMSGIKDPVHYWPGGGHLLIVFREVLRRKIEAAGILKDYDWLLITRSDMMYPIAHPPLALFSPDYIYVPDAERYNGFTDRHVLVPKQYFNNVLGLVSDIFERPEELTRRMQALGREWNTESFIKFRLGEMGLLSRVRFSPYFMYLVRSAEGVTRWSLGTYSHQNRFFIKYFGEYNSSRFIQSLVTEDGDWKYLMGWRRFFNWRMYAYALMRTSSERRYMPQRWLLARMAKRFAILLLQPVETGKLDRIR